ncbi:MAG: hypothetical protein IE914_08785 [Thiotrichales bacterium]|nr:hypothetical protein [Thiotrichales bacterium]
MNNGLMGNLVLFAASKDQRRYFDQLVKHTHVGARVRWYKDLFWPAFGALPLAELWRQAGLLKIRKQNSRKGKSYPRIIWPLFDLVSFVQACWIYWVYLGWLRKEEAAFVGVWNGKKFRQAILLEAVKAQGKSPIFFELGPLPGMTAIDAQGVNAHSSIPRQSSFYQKREMPGQSNFHIGEDGGADTYKLPKRYIFVPFQVVEDSNIYLHSPWIRNMRQLFTLCEATLSVLNGDYCIVFKPHPACDEDYSDLKKRQNARLLFADDVPTPVLVANAEAIMTVNSTVGLEGLMAHKKVFVLGDALFGIEGISFPVANESALKRLFQQIDSLQVDSGLMDKFIDYLQTDYAVPGSAMRNPGERHWCVAESKLRMILQGEPEKAVGLAMRNVPDER